MSTLLSQLDRERGQSGHVTCSVRCKDASMSGACILSPRVNSTGDVGTAVLRRRHWPSEGHCQVPWFIAEGRVVSWHTWPTAWWPLSRAGLPPAPAALRARPLPANAVLLFVSSSEHRRRGLLGRQRPWSHRMVPGRLRGRSPVQAQGQPGR